MAKKKKLIKKNKKIGTRPFILLAVIVLIVIVIFNQISQNKKVDNQKDRQRIITDIVIYPDSNEKLYTENKERLTMNYKTQPGVDFKNVISFYVENMQRLGWNTVSSSETEAIFQKESKKVRVWILYKDSNNDGVDYIIDYYKIE